VHQGDVSVYVEDIDLIYLRQTYNSEEYNNNKNNTNMYSYVVAFKWCPNHNSA
jgi:hypothetical protein